MQKIPSKSLQRMYQPQQPVGQQKQMGSQPLFFNSLQLRAPSMDRQVTPGVRQPEVARPAVFSSSPGSLVRHFPPVYKPSTLQALNPKNPSIAVKPGNIGYNMPLQRIVRPNTLIRVIQRCENEAKAAVRTTRTIIKHGPGNIAGAIENSSGRSWERAVAARHVKNSRSIPRRMHNDSRVNAELKNAVGATIAGGGNCSEHAAVTFFELNKTLPRNTTINIVTLSLDHGIVVVGDLANLDNTFVVDAWSPENTAKTPLSGWYKALSKGSYTVAVTMTTDGVDYVAQVLAQIGNADALKDLRKEGLRKSRKELFESETKKAKTLDGSSLNEYLKSSGTKIFTDEHRIPASW